MWNFFCSLGIPSYARLANLVLTNDTNKIQCGLFALKFLGLEQAKCDFIQLNSNLFKAMDKPDHMTRFLPLPEIEFL